MNRGTYATRILIIALISVGMIASASAAVSDVGPPDMSLDVTASTGVALYHADWYPQGQSTVLICEASGFEATSWDFVFGDGASLTGLSENNVYHTYPGNGTYGASCVAHGEGISEAAMLEVKIGDGGPVGPPSGGDVEVMMAEWYPQELNVILYCNTNFEATSYDWTFGDGYSLTGMSQDNVYHTYQEDGTYTATCTAHEEGMSESDALTFKLGDAGPVVPPGDGNVDLEMAEWYPQELNVVLYCNADFEATSYDWTFDDGYSLTGMSQDNVYHTYQEDGTYTATCTAHGDGVSETDTLTYTLGDGGPVIPPSEGDVEVMMADWYPQELDVVLYCNTDFEATSYDWMFGDGASLTGMSQDNVYHSYTSGGVYTATCTAHSDGMSETGTLTYTLGDGPIVPETSADLSMTEGYPNGTTTELYCEAIGFEATSYDWMFGDGDTLLGGEDAIVMHEYPGEGSYDATCIAYGDGISESAMLEVTIDAPIVPETSADLSMTEGYPDGTMTELYCEAIGFEATSYDWMFGDSTELLGVANDTLMHEYPGNGSYDATCIAYGDEVSESAMLEVVIGDVPTETSAQLSHADWYPQGNDTVLVCETTGFEATTYDYFFGDGASKEGTDRSDVYHTYPGPGSYDASCIAYGDGLSETGLLEVVIEAIEE